MEGHKLFWVYPNIKCWGELQTKNRAFMIARFLRIIKFTPLEIALIQAIFLLIFENITIACAEIFQTTISYGACTSFI
jgi:hypothetical protein